MTVARAAPRMPQPNWKMKMGARMMLHTTVVSDVSMAFFGWPVARITWLSPIMVKVMGVPSRMTCMKSRA